MRDDRQFPFLCRMLGCVLDEFNVCTRCDQELNIDSPSGWYWRYRRRALRAWRYAFGSVVGKRCMQCQKRFWGRGYNREHCSEKCFNEWIPF